MRTTASALFAALAAPLATAQQSPEGHVASVQSLSSTTSLATVMPQGLVTFDGTNLVLTPPLQPPQTLLQLPASVFASFAIDAGGGRVLFAENSTNNLWLVPIAGPAPAAPLATITLPYDAALLSPTHALVSAKTGGFASATNSLVALDLTTGATQLLATLPGASGPLAVDAAGDVYYATSSNSFPAPAASVDVLRLRANVVAQALATSTVLGLADTETVWLGLDAASDLALDDDGDLHFADWWNLRVGELNDVGGPVVWLGEGVVDYATAATSAAALQFVPATTPAGNVFEPFQPQGGTLHVLETDFFSTTALRAVRSAPAVLATSVTSPIPTGPVTLATTGGPALGIGVLAFATVSGPGVTPLAVPGFEQPLLWSSALLTTQCIGIGLLFDATGSASFAFANPGFATPLAATTQVVFVSTDGVVGATAPLALSFGQ
jgi:hypothetical protein